MDTRADPRLHKPARIVSATAHDNSSRLDVFVRDHVTVLIYPMGTDLGKHGLGREKAVYLYERVSSEHLREKFLEQLVAKAAKPEHVRVPNEIFVLTYRFADLTGVYAAAKRVQDDLYSD